ncbi:MAG: GtrA family protein [Bacilli bacterium]
MKQDTRTKEIIRFIVVGLIATIIDYLIRLAIIQVLPETIGQNGILAIQYTIGFSISCIINYALSAIWVFKGVDKKSQKSFLTMVKFLIFAAIGFFIGLGLTYLGDYISQVSFNVSIIDFKIIEFFKNFNLADTRFWCYTLTFMFSTLIVLIFNYITRKKFVFYKTKEQNTKDINKD